MTHLPGYGPPPTPQYSGFLDASAAEPGDEAPLLVRARGRQRLGDETDGSVAQRRPRAARSWAGFRRWALLVNRTGGLMRNPWSTLEANVFALESPAGVGYCTARRSSAAARARTRTIPPAAALAGLVDFSKTSFRRWRRTRFTSRARVTRCLRPDAVARHPGPQRRRRVPDPSRGSRRGDPCTDNDFQRDSMDMLWYGHKHGFVAEAEISTSCGTSAASGTPARKAAGGGRETRDGLRGGAEEEDAAREAAEGSAAAAAKRYRGSTLPRTRRPSASRRAAGSSSPPPTRFAGVASRVAQRPEPVRPLRGRPRRRPRDAGLRHVHVDGSSRRARGASRGGRPRTSGRARATTGATSPSGGRATTRRRPGRPRWWTFTGT